MRACSTRGPAAALFHPYIHEAGERGPFVEAAARAMFTGLSTRTGFVELVRSVYEGLGLAARDCYAAMGHVPDEVRVAGGAARSRAFKTILASVLDVPIRDVAREESGAAGAAMMAAVAIGAEPDMAAAVRTWVEPLLGDRIMPDPALAATYDGAVPALPADPAGDAADLARPRRAAARQAASVLHDPDRDHRRPVHAGFDVRGRAAPRAGRRACDPRHGAALAGRADARTAMPAISVAISPGCASSWASPTRSPRSSATPRSS